MPSVETLTLALRVPADYLSYTLARVMLEEIANGHRDDPWGFSGEEASDLARETLEAMDAIERGR